MRRLIISLLLTSSFIYPQSKKFLISPNQEVIPVDKGTTQKILSRFLPKGTKTTSPCDAKPMYGFVPDLWWPDYIFGFYHKDVCGQWYVIPADATIDTVYFLTGPSVGPGPPFPFGGDSTVIVRIFQSNITRNLGPGSRPGPYRPPCTNWGYYINTNDLENGIAPFVEDATPPLESSWFPTNTPPNGTDSTASFPPFGTPLWGLSGYPVEHIQPNSLIKVVMNDLSPLAVHKGDVIFITFKIPSSGLITDYTNDTRFEIWATDLNGPYPSRDWKFYEHDSGPSSCAGTDRNAI